MNIRLANKFDVNYFITLTKKIHELDFITTNMPVDETYINILFNNIINGQGIALIAQDQNQIGMIVGIIHQNIWYPKLNQLTQILFYVEEEWRHTQVAYKLLKEYNIKVKEFKNKNKIYDSVIYAAKPLHDIDFNKFGYVMAEKIWKMEH